MSIAIHDAAGPGPLPEGFLEVPRLVYAEDPMWIPEDESAMAKRFSEANPWFRTGRSQAFCIPGKARLVVFVTPETAVGGKPAAFFGYWDTVLDEAADRALFGAAYEWARAQGAEAMYGPINFVTYGTYRARLNCEPGGFTFPGEPYNPPAYPARLEELGFAVQQHYVTQLAPAALGAAVRVARQPRLEAVLEAGYRVEAFAHEIWLDNLPEMHGLVDAMFNQNFAYTPLDFDTFAALCGESFIRKTCPKTSTIAYAPDGSIAGFFLVYPHYGPLVVQSAGADRVHEDDLNYAEHFPLLQARGEVAAVSKTVAVAKEHRSRGVMTALTISMFARGEGVFSHWYGALIQSDNYNRRYGDGLAEDARWYAVFGKDL